MSVLAEKIVTTIGRGDATTRERDFADALLITARHNIDAGQLSAAIPATAFTPPISSRSSTRDPAVIVPGAIVGAGDADAPAVVEVVDIALKSAGDVVHLRILPGDIEDYAALVRRALPAA